MNYSESPILPDQATLTRVGDIGDIPPNDLSCRDFFDGTIPARQVPSVILRLATGVTTGNGSFNAITYFQDLGQISHPVNDDNGAFPEHLYAIPMSHFPTSGDYEFGALINFWNSIEQNSYYASGETTVSILSAYTLNGDGLWITDGVLEYLDGWYDLYGNFSWHYVSQGTVTDAASGPMFSLSGDQQWHLYDSTTHTDLGVIFLKDSDGNPITGVANVGGGVWMDIVAGVPQGRANGVFTLDDGLKHNVNDGTDSGTYFGQLLLPDGLVHTFDNGSDQGGSSGVILYLGRWRRFVDGYAVALLDGAAYKDGELWYYFSGGTKTLAQGIHVSSLNGRYHTYSAGADNGELYAIDGNGIAITGNRNDLMGDGKWYFFNGGYPTPLTGYLPLDSGGPFHVLVNGVDFGVAGSDSGSTVYRDGSNNPLQGVWGDGYHRPNPVGDGYIRYFTNGIGAIYSGVISDNVGHQSVASYGLQIADQYANGPYLHNGTLGDGLWHKLSTNGGLAELLNGAFVCDLPPYADDKVRYFKDGVLVGEAHQGYHLVNFFNGWFGELYSKWCYVNNLGKVDSDTSMLPFTLIGNAGDEAPLYRKGLDGSQFSPQVPSVSFNLDEYWPTEDGLSYSVVGSNDAVEFSIHHDSPEGVLTTYATGSVGHISVPLSNFGSQGLYAIRAVVRRNNIYNGVPEVYASATFYVQLANDALDYTYENTYVNNTLPSFELSWSSTGDVVGWDHLHSFRVVEGDNVYLRLRRIGNYPNVILGGNQLEGLYTSLMCGGSDVLPLNQYGDDSQIISGEYSYYIIPTVSAETANILKGEIWGRVEMSMTEGGMNGVMHSAYTNHLTVTDYTPPTFSLDAVSEHGSSFNTTLNVAVSGGSYYFRITRSGEFNHTPSAIQVTLKRGSDSGVDLPHTSGSLISSNSEEFNFTNPTLSGLQSIAGVVHADIAVTIEGVVTHFSTNDITIIPVSEFWTDVSGLGSPIPLATPPFALTLNVVGAATGGIELSLASDTPSYVFHASKVVHMFVLYGLAGGSDASATSLDIGICTAFNNSGAYVGPQTFILPDTFTDPIHQQYGTGDYHSRVIIFADDAVWYVSGYLNSSVTLPDGYGGAVVKPVLPKKTLEANKIPTTADLVLGELAVDVVTGRMYVRLIDDSIFHLNASAEGGNVIVDNITDATTLGRAILQAADQYSALTALGAASAQDATDAITAAFQAATTASDAITAAGAAQGAAGAAATAASNAATAAAGAQTTANTAVTAAGNAQTTANTAHNAAVTAQNSADAAQATADSALTVAENAQATADQAVSNAGSAMSTAVAMGAGIQVAQDAAATAQTTANNAVALAGDAQATADSALSAANTAQSSATSAQNSANTALDEISNLTANGITDATSVGKNLVRASSGDVALQAQGATTVGLALVKASDGAAARSAIGAASSSSVSTAQSAADAAAAAATAAQTTANSAATAASDAQATGNSAQTTANSAATAAAAALAAAQAAQVTANHADSVQAADITDATSVGRSVLTATNAAGARSTLGTLSAEEIAGYAIALG